MFLNVRTSNRMFLFKITRGDRIHSVLSFTGRASLAVVKKKQALQRTIPLTQI